MLTVRTEAVAARSFSSKNGLKVHLESPRRLLRRSWWRRVSFNKERRTRNCSHNSTFSAFNLKMDECGFVHRPVYCLYISPFSTTGGAENHGLLNINNNNNNSKLAFCYVGMAALSTLPLNRPATVEGSEGKGAWCERCWATDTGPQKESDATGSRKEDKEEKEREQEEEREQIKRLFKARPRRK